MPIQDTGRMTPPRLRDGPEPEHLSDREVLDRAVLVGNVRRQRSERELIHVPMCDAVRYSSNAGGS